MPNNVEEIRYSTFYNSKANIISIGTGVTRIRQQAFFNAKVTTLIVNPVYPPIITKSSYVLFYAGNVGSIYVPDESVELYKASYGWISYADKIYPLSEYTGS